jgi:transcriptional regulator with XRE-family HTH domain/predicted small integral membrane protein
VEDDCMAEHQLGEKIAHYRKERGLSQEKVAEYMEVSRQAVTKWESNISRPSSDNLIKLAKLFEISVDVLLDSEMEDSPDREKISTGKTPWIFIGISTICILAYLMVSNRLGCFSGGALICMFVIYVPIQLFLHIYFSNAICNNSFSGIAGFDDKIKYHIPEVKKLLVRLDLHIGMVSTVYIFLFCVLNCMNLKLERLDGLLNGFLIALYVLNFVVIVMIYNYLSIDKIYCDEEDKKRAIRSIPVAAVFILLIFVGIGITGFLFEVKGIENNTAPAMKLCGLLLVAVATATAGFFLENNRIKKWKPANEKYNSNIFSIVSLLLCVIAYGLMFIV